MNKTVYMGIDQEIRTAFGMIDQDRKAAETAVL